MLSLVAIGCSARHVTPLVLVHRADFPFKRKLAAATAVWRQYMPSCSDGRDICPSTRHRTVPQMLEAVWSPGTSPATLCLMLQHHCDPTLMSTRLDHPTLSPAESSETLDQQERAYALARQSLAALIGFTQHAKHEMPCTGECHLAQSRCSFKTVRTATVMLQYQRSL